MHTKQSIRNLALKQRDAIEPSWRVKASKLIATHLNQLNLQAHNAPIAGYWPLGSEADPRPLMMDLAQQGFSLCLPITQNEHINYHHFAFGDELAAAGFGTFGPNINVPQIRPRTLLVPLVAFDKQGARIGWGKGCYDRSIAKLKADGQPLLTIGIAFSSQQVEHIPSQAHDISLDFILTETGIRC
jgi:5-formyltetrahydrofolate cyclo-ligase